MKLNVNNGKNNINEKNFNIKNDIQINNKKQADNYNNKNIINNNNNIISNDINNINNKIDNINYHKEKIIKKIYSYECINIISLRKYIYEGTDKAEIKIIMKNKVKNHGL